MLRNLGCDYLSWNTTWKKPKFSYQSFESLLSSKTFEFNFIVNWCLWKPFFAGKLWLTYNDDSNRLDHHPLLHSWNSIGNRRLPWKSLGSRPLWWRFPKVSLFFINQLFYKTMIYVFAEYDNVFVTIIAEGALVPELKLQSNAWTQPMNIVQPMPSLLEISLFGVLTLVISLASTNDLMNTSIEMDYAPLRMSKSKEFVKFMFTFVHTIFLDFRM